MSVYVDRFKPIPGKGGIEFVAHMIADNVDELEEMANKLGLYPTWLQSRGTDYEHYDLVEGKRELAVKLGAKEITARELVTVILGKRKESKQ